MRSCPHKRVRFLQERGKKHDKTRYSRSPGDIQQKVLSGLQLFAFR